MPAEPVSLVEWTVAVAAGLIASLVAVLIWAEDKGRPFACRAATLWAVGLIVVLAGAAAVIGGLLLHPLRPEVPPYLYALPLPFTLCGRKIAGMPPADGGDQARPLPAVLTIGISLMLRRLNGAMATHLTDYLHKPSTKSWSMTTIERRSEDLFERLRDYVDGDKKRTAIIERFIKDLRMAVQKHDRLKNQDARAAAKARSAARAAHRGLRRQAYLWRFDQTQKPTAQRQRLRRWLPWAPKAESLDAGG